MTKVDMFLEGRCKPGTIKFCFDDVNQTMTDCLNNDTQVELDPLIGKDAGCTTLTLTKIKDVEQPKWGPPLFGYQYPTCEVTDELWDPEDDVTQNLCDREVYMQTVSFSDMIGALSAGLIIQLGFHKISNRFRGFHETYESRSFRTWNSFHLVKVLPRRISIRLTPLKKWLPLVRSQLISL